MHSCLIVDDERQARTLIRNLIEKNFIDISIVGEAGTLAELTNLLTTEKPDIVFLDIQLGNQNTMHNFNSIPRNNAEIIFITAHAEFAAEAFLHEASGYLLKPLITKDFIRTVNRCLEMIAYKRKSPSSELGDTKTNLTINTSDGIEVVYIPGIVRLESDNNYSRIYLENGTKIFVSKTLKEFERILRDKGFLRVHQSHLINAVFIRKFTHKNESLIELTDQTEIPVSVRKRSEVKDYLNTKH